MSPEMVTAISTIIGCLISGYVALKVAGKQHDKTEAVVIYRLSELEKKVEKHNQVVERTAALERDVKTAFNKVNELKSDIKDIKNS